MSLPEKNEHTYEPMTAEEFKPYIGVVAQTLNEIMEATETPSQRIECVKWAMMLGAITAEHLAECYNDQIKTSPNVSPLEYLAFSMIASRITNA